MSFPVDRSDSDDEAVVADGVCGLQVPARIGRYEVIQVQHSPPRSPQEGMNVRVACSVGGTYNPATTIDRIALAEAATQIPEIGHNAVCI